jgi:hypothetical protein
MVGQFKAQLQQELDLCSAHAWSADQLGLAMARLEESCTSRARRAMPPHSGCSTAPRPVRAGTLLI